MLRIHTKTKKKFTAPGTFRKGLIDLVATMLGLTLACPLILVQ